MSNDSHSEEQEDAQSFCVEKQVIVEESKQDGSKSESQENMKKDS